MEIGGWRDWHGGDRWSCGGSGVVIGVGVNGFFFFSGFAGICDRRCGGCGVAEIGGVVVAMAL